MAEITWDSDSYIYYSQSLLPNLRPVGYSVFLSVLYFFSHSISVVVYSQFTLYFISIIVLLKTVHFYKPLSVFQYYLLGFLLLAEPAALYHCNVILSDILFSSLTYLYLVTLLLYINTKKSLLLAIHFITLICCIETRHIALFFPFFSVAVFIIYLGGKKMLFICTLLTLLVFVGIYACNIRLNKRIYGVPVYSPFAGWTQANNALDILPDINVDTSSIHDNDVRKLQAFFASYLDTTSFKPTHVGADYLWDPRSPLNVLRRHVDDSLVNKNGHGDFTLTWYVLAPRYARYGSYIVSHFPYQYLLHFILPNVHTLIKPDDGEMTDYYIAKGAVSSISLQRYNLTDNALCCRKQIYKDCIDGINLWYYKLRLILFVPAAMALLIFRRSLKKETKKMLAVFCLFVFIFYCFMLYSTCFITRYLLPALPLLTIVIFVVLVNFLPKQKPILYQNSFDRNN